MQSITVTTFGGPEQLTLATTPAPTPARGEVLVRIEAAGVNPVDTYILTGTYALRPDLPYTPGLEGAGVIAAVGDDVDPARIGARVFVSMSSSGTYAELCTCKAEDAHELPDELSFDQGAGVWIAYATAWRALFQLGQLRGCESLLVHGASGAVGLALVQWAASRGVDVIGTASSKHGMDAALESGASAVVDHSSPGYQDELLALTGGRGFDMIAENAAHSNLDADMELVARRGRILVIGSRHELLVNPRKLMAREATVQGVMLFGMTESEKREAARAIQAAARAQLIRPVVRRAFDLKDARAAHELVMKRGAAGKIVLRTGG